MDATIFIGLDAAEEMAEISDAAFKAGEAALKNAASDRATRPRNDIKNEDAEQIV